MIERREGGGREPAHVVLAHEDGAREEGEDARAVERLGGRVGRVPVNGTRRDSEALGGTRRRSEALGGIRRNRWDSAGFGGTRRHSEAFGGTRWHSVALTP